MHTKLSYHSRCLTALVVAMFMSTAEWADAQPEKTANFLIVRLGDEAADMETAGEYVVDIADYFARRLAKVKPGRLQGWITNDADSAMALVESLRPIFAYVPSGFYVEYLRRPSLDAVAVAQSPRFGQNVERYYLIGAKDGPQKLDGLRHKIVRGTFGLPERFLKRAVFPATFQPGKDFSLQESSNLADELFSMLEGAPGSEQAADALLVDEELKTFFEEDRMTWDGLHVIWKSEPLVRELFVTLGIDWKTEEREAFAQTLFAMKNDELGSELLMLLNCPGFTEVNQELLARTIEKYDSK